MIWPSRAEIQARTDWVRELSKQGPLESILRGLVTLVVFSVMAVLIVACSSAPTAPATPLAFPYAGCTMIQAGIDRLPNGQLDNVWQQWRCTDGHRWQVNADGTVFGMTP